MRDQHSTIAIVGGGFSGAVLATQLLRRDRASLRVVVIERLSQPGRGLAYSMQYNWHLLNVPAGKMSAFPDEPEHFLRWAQRNYDRAAAPGSFLPRRVYGQYVHAVLRETQAGSASRLHWLHDEVTQLRPAGAKTELMLRSGERVVADKVVLAFGNLPASDPALPGRRPDSGRYFRHAWSANALEGVEGEQDVLLIGSGLTAVDMVIALRARGFTGRVHMLSRRGLLAHPHKATREWPLYWDENSPRTVRGLLRLIREQIALALERNVGWRAVIDALRPVTAQIWQSLPEVEKRRFLRHARAHWEVARHRVAPDVGRIVGYQMIEGRVRLLAGRILGYEETSHRAEITFLRRENGWMERFSVDRVINCTGPETDCRKLEDALLTDLRKQGMARPDALYLGLDVASDGAVVDRYGAASSTLFAVGSVRKGQLWESTAVPELRVQVADLAELLLPSEVSHGGPVVRNFDSNETMGFESSKV